MLNYGKIYHNSFASSWKDGDKIEIKIDML